MGPEASARPEAQNTLAQGAVLKPFVCGGNILGSRECALCVACDVAATGKAFKLSEIIIKKNQNPFQRRPLL